VTLASWVSGTGTTVALDGSDGIKVLRGVRGLDGPPIANTIDQRVNAGAVLVAARRPNRVIQLPLLIDTTTIDVGDVVRLFQSGTLVADSGRELRSVIYEDGFEGEWTVDSGGVVGMTHRKFALSLCVLDPWWYGNPVLEGLTFSEGTAWNAVDVLWDADLPWNGGASATITVDGDAATPCRVVVLADVDPVTEVSFTVGDVGWVTARTIDAAAILTVDSRDGSRGPYTGSSLLGAAETPIDWSWLTETSQPFLLEPGDVSVVFGAVSDTAPAAWISWEPRWQTP
jgi:hypothetical protein